MDFQRVTVYLPCHTLDDFPTWLDEAEADDLLSAWTAAWHPTLIAATGRMPGWASVDLPPADADATLGIVPATWDDRFAGSVEGVCATGGRFVRQVSGSEAMLAAAGVIGGSPADPLAADFHALGLAWLLGELLARRMRSSTGLDPNGFEEAAVAAARAATAGDGAAARERLRECFDCLEASRSRYYPVDVWLLDLVLLAESTFGRSLEAELDSPVPAALVATGDMVEALARRNPAVLQKVRSRCAAGMLAPAGGRADSRPIDACAPEAILESFRRGRAAWEEHVGKPPATYAQGTGGSSAILPQMLGQFRYEGAVWCLFDGTALPDPGTSRVRWEGTGGACIDAVARAPLDARRARTILSLAESIGEAMDQDHTAILQFAHHPGTASRWFEALRRIGGWTRAFGEFVTPDELFRRTAGAGAIASFEPDLFPSMPPPDGPDQATADPIGDLVAVAREDAVRLLDARGPLDEVLGPPTPPRPIAAATKGTTASATDRTDGGLWRALSGGLFAGGLFAGATAEDDELVLANESIRVQVQRSSGGILSLRRPGDGRNRLSQRLSLRTTRPAPPSGAAWEPVEERAEHARMLADSIERLPAGEGRGEGIVSRGRLVDSGDRDVGGFTQRLTLVGEMPLVVLEFDLRLSRDPAGPVLEEHAGCRFAWNENDDVEIRRSLHTQSVATERNRFTAPHFIELLGTGRDSGSRGGADSVTIFTCGLPWHVRTGPHMLDSILLARGGCQATRRMAVGLGIERPWDVALAVAAGRDPRTAGALLPANVRLTAGPVATEGGRIVAARIGLLESAGRAGNVRIEWPADLAAVRRCGAFDPFDGDPGRNASSGDAASDIADAADVAIDGRTTTVHLRRYEWLHLDLRFRPAVPAALVPAALGPA